MKGLILLCCLLSAICLADKSTIKLEVSAIVINTVKLNSKELMKTKQLIVKKRTIAEVKINKKNQTIEVYF